MQSECFSFKASNKLENEDQLIDNSETTEYWDAVYGVADGVGGNAGGKIAATIAIEEIMRSTPKHENDFDQTYKKICEALKEAAKPESELTNMATTLTTCFIKNSEAYIAHVGDTRAYHLRGNGIMQRTVDQTELQKLLDEGVISKARAVTYPRKNVLLSALSAKSNYTIYTNKFSLEPKDRIVILSDGAYSKVQPREIRDISLASQNITAFKENLLELIVNRSPSDDYSAVCVEIQTTNDRL